MGEGRVEQAGIDGTIVVSNCLGLFIKSCSWLLANCQVFLIASNFFSNNLIRFSADKHQSAGN